MCFYEGERVEVQIARRVDFDSRRDDKAGAAFSEMKDPQGVEGRWAPCFERSSLPLRGTLRHSRKDCAALVVDVAPCSVFFVISEVVRSVVMKEARRSC